VVAVTLALPRGQTSQGKVVDAFDNGIAGATVLARYREPDKPIRRVLLDDGSVTDDEGDFVLDNVGIDVSFYVDVLAPGSPPAHSKQLKLAAGTTKIEKIVLGEKGATVVVDVTDKEGDPLKGVEVVLFADSANFAQSARGSWLFPMGFRKRVETSESGTARFTGVPPGKVVVRAKTSVSSLQGVATAASNQEVSITLVAPE